MALALFDFDGTISFRDSFAGFIRYLVGPARYRLGVLCLLPVVAGFLFGFIRSWRAKELMSIYFFGGRDAEGATGDGFTVLSRGVAQDRAKGDGSPA